MKKIGLSAFALVASLAAASPAYAAAEFTYSPGSGGLSGGQTGYADFDTTFGNVSGSGYQVLTPPGLPDGAEPATGDQGDDFFSVLANGNALFTFDAADAIGAVGLDYGSADDYNTFVVYLSNGLDYTFTGQDILDTVPADANGNQAANATNGRLTFTSGGSDVFITGLRLTSTRNSLEIDNIGVGAVPEPGTWMMMLLGFGAIGFAMRRRGVSGLTQVA